MKRHRSTQLVLSLLASSALVWIAASCATQGDDSRPAPNDDGGLADSRSVITEPDAVALESCTHGRWCAVKPPVAASISLNGIWGTGPSDVWIAGSPDVAIHWNGSEFSSSRLKTNQTLFGIWGSGPNDVWAFSAGNAVWHNTGEGSQGWSGFDKDAGGDPPPWSGPIFGMWGRSSTDVWAVGPYVDYRGQPTVWHADGWNGGVPNWVSSITTSDANPWDREPSFNAVWGSDRGEVWVVGDKGKTRYTAGWQDGAAIWTIVDSGTSLPLYALWSAGNGEVWAAGGDGGSITTVKSWAPIPITHPSLRTVNAFCVTPNREIWIAGQVEVSWSSVGGVVRGVPSAADPNSYTWTEVLTRPPGGYVGLTAIWGESGGGFWTVSAQKESFRGTVAGDGSVGWTDAPTHASGTMRDIWGASANDVWLVGRAGAVRHWDGATWSVSRLAVDGIPMWQDLNAVHGGPGGDVWAVGSGVALHRVPGAGGSP